MAVIFVFGFKMFAATLPLPLEDLSKSNRTVERNITAPLHIVAELQDNYESVCAKIDGRFAEFTSQ